MVTILEKITICFENVEVITVPAKYISNLCVDGIKKFRRSFQNDEDGLAILLGTFAERITIKIDKSAKDKFVSNIDSELFQRITRHSDITNIDFRYTDGIEESIYTDWEDATKGGEENLLQKCSFDDEGTLIIKIGNFAVRAE